MIDSQFLIVVLVKRWRNYNLVLFMGHNEVKHHIHKKCVICKSEIYSNSNEFCSNHREIYYKIDGIITKVEKGLRSQNPKIPIVLKRITNILKYYKFD